MSITGPLRFLMEKSYNAFFFVSFTGSSLSYTGTVCGAVHSVRWHVRDSERNDLAPAVFIAGPSSGNLCTSTPLPTASSLTACPYTVHPVLLLRGRSLHCSALGPLALARWWSCPLSPLRYRINVVIACHKMMTTIQSRSRVSTRVYTFALGSL